MRQCLKAYSSITVRPLNPEYLLISPAYTAVPSLLDYTTGAVPVTFADDAVDSEIFQHNPLNEKDVVNWKMCQSSQGQAIGSTC